MFFSLSPSSHLNKTTTYEDPRKWPGGPALADHSPSPSNSSSAASQQQQQQQQQPEPRSVVLSRHEELGFGFVAGSEKPVIVR